MSYCPWCGHQRTPGAPFCANCGRRLDDEVPASGDANAATPLVPPTQAALGDRLLVVGRRWARRWPYLTAIVIGVVVWSFGGFALAMAIPPLGPVVGLVAFVAGVTVGARAAGLEGARRWVIASVSTLAIGLVLAGAILVVPDIRLPWGLPAYSGHGGTTIPITVGPGPRTYLVRLECDAAPGHVGVWGAKALSIYVSSPPVACGWEVTAPIYDVAPLPAGYPAGTTAIRLPAGDTMLQVVTPSGWRLWLSSTP